MLVREVDELLNVGSVGLYEFMWILNSAGSVRSEATRLQYARQALRTLLENDSDRLVLLMWAQPDYLKELHREVEPEDFGDQQLEAPYVAIVRD